MSAHAAAREVGKDTPARSAARAAGQTVATAHVRTHAIGAAQYALQALSRLEKGDHQNIIAQERVWQYQSLLNVIETIKEFLCCCLNWVQVFYPYIASSNCGPAWQNFIN